MTERTFELSDFHSIRLCGPHDVIVSTGTDVSVTAEGDDDALAAVDVTSESGTLAIRSRGKRRLFGFGRGGDPVTFQVTMPELRNVSMEGSGDVQVDRVSGPSFHGSIAGSGDLAINALEAGECKFSIAGSGDIQIDSASGETFHCSIAGSGDIAIDDLQVTEAKFSVAGSGDIRAAGRARHAGVSIAGSGDADISDMEAEDAEIAIVGSGDVQARATGTAKVSIMGSGDVQLSGGAQCTLTHAGSGSFNCS